MYIAVQNQLAVSWIVLYWHMARAICLNQWQKLGRGVARSPQFLHLSVWKLLHVCLLYLIPCRFSRSMLDLKKRRWKSKSKMNQARQWNLWKGTTSKQGMNPKPSILTITHACTCACSAFVTYEYHTPLQPGQRAQTTGLAPCIHVCTLLLIDLGWYMSTSEDGQSNNTLKFLHVALPTLLSWALFSRQ